MKTAPNSLRKTHGVNSWLNLILSSLLVIFVFISIVINLLSTPTEAVEEVGLKTFRMFTVLSNMFVAITAAMSIPFAVDGIRQKNYHLPRWIVNLTFASVTCITLTFLITVFILSPKSGFVLMMATGSFLFMHTLVPIISIVSFLFINIYHNVKFKTTFYALIPVLAYAVTYIVSVMIIGEENGGWRDHYHFLELMPWYCVFVIVMLLTFGIANLLRAVHNRMHKRDKAATERYYQNAPEYDLPTIEEAIVTLARENKKNDAGGEVIVPRRIIKFFENKYQSQKPLSYLCGVYLEEYLK
jgi:hypothetical protein